MASSARGLSRFFVGNIPWHIGNKELNDFFVELGPVVRARVVYDKQTGGSKRFGFVTFGLNRNEILKNLENRNSLRIDGHYLVIEPIDEKVINNYTNHKKRINNTNE